MDELVWAGEAGVIRYERERAGTSRAAGSDVLLRLRPRPISVRRWSDGTGRDVPVRCLQSERRLHWPHRLHRLHLLHRLRLLRLFRPPSAAASSVRRPPPPPPSSDVFSSASSSVSSSACASVSASSSVCASASVPVSAPASISVSASVPVSSSASVSASSSASPPPLPCALTTHYTTLLPIEHQASPTDRAGGRPESHTGAELHQRAPPEPPHVH